MSSFEEYIFKRLFDKAEYLECKGKVHIGSTTGKPSKWSAHPLCRKRLKDWIGFNELRYAKSNDYCELCFLLYQIKQFTSCSERVGSEKE